MRSDTVFLSRAADTSLPGYDDSQQREQQSSEGKTGAGREWHKPYRRGTGHHVRAGAEPASPRPLQGGDHPAQAAPTHTQEPRLRSQLPREASDAEGGAGEAKDRVAARGGKARHGERQHAPRAGLLALEIRSAAKLCPDCGTQPCQPSEGAFRSWHQATGASQGGSY